MDPLARLLPRLYLHLAFSSLLTAAVAITLDPAALVGFFYHPRLLAVVHLITLGWLTSSLLGVLHLAAPRLLGKPLPITRVDFFVFGLFFLGATGIIGHFWIREMSGVGWSGVLVVLVILRVGVRFLVEPLSGPGSQAVSAPLPGATSTPQGLGICGLLAMLNFVGAATLGVAIVLDRYVDVLPGFVLHHVFAHAHLAALGWATLLLLGLVGVLRSKTQSSDFTAAVLGFELAVLVLFVSLLADFGRGMAALVVTGAMFLLVLKALGGQRPNRTTLELRQALLYLSLTCILGVGLALSAGGGAFRLQLFVVYGTLGLLGFLGAMPFVLLRSFEGAEDSLERTLGRWLWGASVPLLALGFAQESLPVLRGGGVALLVATVVAWRQPWRKIHQEPMPEELSLRSRSTPFSSTP